MKSREYKNRIYEEFARIGGALSSATRLEFLDLLGQGPQSVDTLARKSSQSVANTSQHLKILREAHVVTVERRGARAIYSLAGDDIRGFLARFRSLAEEHLLEIERVTEVYLRDRAALETIDSQELIGRLREGGVTLVDVRPADEYRSGHIPGAVSVPLEQLEHRLEEIPADHTIVAYCRGPYCVLAVEAVALLRGRGFQAMRLADGVAEWGLHGQSVATADKQERGSA